MTKLFSAQKAPLLRSSSVKYREVNDSSSILWHTNTNRRDSTIILRYVFVIANPSILFLFVFILIWKLSINNISARLMNTSACIFIMQRYDQSLINLFNSSHSWWELSSIGVRKRDSRFLWNTVTIEGVLNNYNYELKYYTDVYSWNEFVLR